MISIESTFEKKVYTCQMNSIWILDFQHFYNQSSLILMLYRYYYYK